MKIVFWVQADGEITISTPLSYSEYENLPEKEYNEFMDNIREQIENGLPSGLKLNEWEWCSILED